jgi:hypothetical protein
LVQNDGATTHVFGDSNAINTVADGIYHLGFATRGNRLLNEDGNRNATLEDVAFWLSEFLADDLVAGALAGDRVDLAVTPSTGKGLDSLVSIITTDHGLIQRISTSEIVEGARAADAMNVLIIEAIIATGVANDGIFHAADIRDVNAYLRANHSDQWVVLHGDDEEDGSETGFHLVQGDGAETHLFGDSNAVNTVADGIYHLGFGTSGNRLLNEDGNRNASLEDIADWLNELLDEDLRLGLLANSAVDLTVTPSTGTGLDSLITTITTDRGLILRVPTSEIVDAALAADEMNKFIIEAIRATGVAYDNTFDAGDIRLVNGYLRANHRDRWVVLHGDDEGDSETGFHLVQNDGAKSELFGDDNAINTVADGIYHLGFGTSGHRLLNEDGNRNASLEDVAFWLNELLADDFATGSLIDKNQVPTEQSVAAGIVYELPGIEIDPTESYLDVPHATALELAQGTVAISFTTESSSGRQTLLSKDHRGYQKGGHLTASVVNGRVEVRLQSDSESQVIKSSSGSVVVGQEHQLMVSFGEAGGFHVYLDGQVVGVKPTFTTGIASNDNSLVLGASTMWRDGGRLKLRDYFRGELSDLVVWNRQLSLVEVGFAARSLTGPPDPVATQGTSSSGLNQIVDMILADRGLNHRIPSSEIVAGAKAADSMNVLIIEAIEKTGVANDGKLDAGDARDVNEYLHSKYRDRWIILHGDDEDGAETGFHLVQGDGATTHIFGDSNLVNTVADGIYHLGFGSRSGRLLNEDGNNNASFKDVAFWLSEFLAEDLQNGSLSNSTVDLAVEGSTRTGLDSLITIIDTDAGLISRIPTSERVAGGRAAAAMNDLIIEAIEATGVANDGVFNAGDIRDINAYLRSEHEDAWIELHGDDENDSETGFHLVQNDGALTHLFGDDNAVNTIADGLYHLGFPIQGNRVLNEDGRANASLEDIAYWLNELLAEDLRMGSLASEVVDLTVMPSTGTGLDSIVTTIMADPGLNLRIRTSEQVEGARAAYGMNRLIVEAISATGVANDGLFDKADIYEINAYLQGKHREAWVELHGDDEQGIETGFHLVQRDGAKTHWFGDENAINTVADGIYHLGFGTSCGRLLNEDGNRNASMEDVAYWLNELLVEDLAAGTLVNEDLLPSEEEIAAAAVLEVDEILDSREAITHVELAHQEAFELSQGTIALSFTADSVDGRQTLFSKDHRGYQQGGHLTAFIRDGRLEVRFQSDWQSQVISSDAGSIVAGQQHALAISFGEQGGFRVYLDGELVGEKPEFTVGLIHNMNSIVLGASTTYRSGESLNLRDHFVGVIQDFAVYAAQAEIDEVAAPSPTFDPPVVDSVLEDIMNNPG